MLTTGWIAVGLMALVIVALAAEGDGGNDGGGDDNGDGGDPPDGGANDPLAGLTAEQQAALDARIAKERDRLDMKYKTAAEKAREEAKAEAEAELKKQHELEQMEEADRLKAELEDLKAQREAEKQRASELEAELARAEFMAANAGDLPQAYRAMVQGDDEEALQESLEAAQAQFEADFEARTGRKPNMGGASRPGDQTQGGQSGGAGAPAGDGSSLDDYMPTADAR